MVSAMTYDPFALADDTLDAYEDWLNRKDEYPAGAITAFDVHLDRWNQLYYNQEKNESMISLVERRVWGMAQNIGHWQVTSRGLYFKGAPVADINDLMSMTDHDLWNTVRRAELADRIESL